MVSKRPKVLGTLHVQTINAQHELLKNVQNQRSHGVSTYRLRTIWNGLA